MRRWHGYALAGLILIAGLAARWADPVVLEGLRLAVFSAYQRIAPRPYLESPVRIVDIDEDSLAKFGQWPWPRGLIARLIGTLQEAGAVSVLDIVLAEPDRNSPSRFLAMVPDDARARVEKVLRPDDLPDSDVVLAEIIARGATITGFTVRREPGVAPPARSTAFAHTGDDPRQFVPTYPGAVTSLPKLEAIAAGNGSVAAVPESNGILHRVPLVIAIGQELYPSLASEALRVAQGAKTIVMKASGAQGVESLGAATGVSAIKIGRAVVPTDSQARLWLYDTGPIAVRHVPAWQILESPERAQDLAGAIAIIGVSAAGLGDTLPTPSGHLATGAEIQAQAIEQIINGQFLERPVWAQGAEIVYLFVLGLLVTVTMLLPRIGPIIATGMGGILILGGIGVSWWAFSTKGLLLDPVYPVIVGTAVYLANTVTRFILSEAQRRQVRTAFGQYVAPELVEELADNPQALRLGGERKDMTILFLDIRGFTTISEALNPEELTSVLNHFLTAMSREIQNERGTIDKYMGDAIMAFWNAPLDDPDHVPHACRAALAMIDAVPRINDELLEAGLLPARLAGGLKCGIGVNTGPCLVGNMGSEQRFNYSVLGDSVNLASRLEAQCKNYGVSIIVGEATKEGAPGYALLELDLIQVVGKTEAARIFALLGLPDVAESDSFRALSEAHQGLLDAYRTQDWAHARQALAACRPAGQPFALDGLYDLYESRIAELRAAPPAPGWNGVYVARTK